MSKYKMSIDGRLRATYSVKIRLSKEEIAALKKITSSKTDSQLRSQMSVWLMDEVFRAIESRGEDI